MQPGTPVWRVRDISGCVRNPVPLGTRADSSLRKCERLAVRAGRSRPMRRPAPDGAILRRLRPEILGHSQQNMKLHRSVHRFRNCLTSTGPGRSNRAARTNRVSAGNDDRMLINFRAGQENGSKKNHTFASTNGSAAAVHVVYNVRRPRIKREPCAIQGLSP